MPMARGASLNLAGAICTKVVLVAIIAVLSWQLGAASLGRYAQAYALLTVLVAVAGLPFSAGASRFVAMHLTNSDDGAVRGTARLAVGGTLVCSVLLAAPLFAFADVVAHHVFHDAGLVTPLRLVAVALPAAALTEAALVITVGFRRMRARAAIKLVLEPVLRLGLTTGLVLVGVGLNGAMVALVASSTVAALLALRALRRHLRPLTGVPRYEPRALIAFSAVSGTAWLATTGLVWADTLILGALSSSADVGVYTVATKIVVLATFAMPAVTQAFSPRITDLYERGLDAELRHAYYVVTGWNLVLSLPAFALLLAFPAELLSLFGPGFSSTTAVTVTMVLVVGQIVHVATGPGGMMLTMSGRPAWNLVDNSVTLALNVALNLVLIPLYGILGAAVAWAVSLTVGNAARLVQVWLLMRMGPFAPAQLRTVLATAVAGSTALVATHPFSGAARLVIGAATLGATYALAIAVLHRRTEDRLVVRMLTNRTLAVLRPRGQA